MVFACHADTIDRQNNTPPQPSPLSSSVGTMPVSFDVDPARKVRTAAMLTWRETTVSIATSAGHSLTIHRKRQ